jgi:hypothetical protein
MRSITGLVLVVASAGVVQLEMAALAAPELGNFTASAILGWYAWHTASKTIPGLVEHFRRELAELRDDERVQRQAFHESLAAERAARHADSELIAAALRQLAERLK